MLSRVENVSQLVKTVTYARKIDDEDDECKILCAEEAGTVPTAGKLPLVKSAERA